MKRIILILALALLPLCPGALCAQTLTMDEGYVAFDYPESWLVVSPQLCSVYAPLLTQAGLDPEALREQMEQQHILSRAYNADFSQSMSVLIASDELSAEIFDIGEVTDGPSLELCSGSSTLAAVPVEELATAFKVTLDW